MNIRKHTLIILATIIFCNFLYADEMNYEQHKSNFNYDKSLKISEQIRLEIPDMRAGAGEMVGIPVIVRSGFNNVAVIELHIGFGNTLLDYKNMSSQYLSSGDINVSEGKANIVWIYEGNPIGIPDNDTLITLNFAVSGGSQTGDTSPIKFVGTNIIGDANENSISLSLSNGLFTVGVPIPPIRLEIPDMRAEAGETVGIPVIVRSGFNNVAVIELHVGFDNTLLDYKNMSSQYLSSGDINVSEGKANIVWIYDGNPIGIPDNDTLITLNFAVSGGSQTGDTSPIKFVGTNIIGDANENSISLSLSNGLFTVGVVSATRDDLFIQNTFILKQNFPNPFNPTTTLQYGLPEASDVYLIISDISGRKVRNWHVSNQQAGWHKFVWDGTDQFSRQVSTGVYIYSLRAGNFVDTKKMVFMK